MNGLRELARRLGMLKHRRQFDMDLEEEMRLHLELRQQQQIELRHHRRRCSGRCAARVWQGNLAEGRKPHGVGLSRFHIQ